MNIKEDTLFILIDEKAKWFAKEANNHKNINRGLWFTSSLIAVAVAFFSNFEFTIGPFNSSNLAAALSILLPLITGYTLLRGAENLWLLEIEMRNRLIDLRTKMILEYEREETVNQKFYEESYFAIMNEANERWISLKESQSS